jgi:membrane protein implicated in regulation of membrane protease activity
MFRKLFGGLDVPVTSRGFDAAFQLVVGGACSFVAVLAAVLGHWWAALMFAVCAFTPLLMAWRYARGRDPISGSAPDPSGK